MSPENPWLEETQTNRAIAKPMTYSIKNALTPNPDVRLVFEGLLWFIFHGTDECQVGIHNTTHDSMGHDHQHDLDIKVWTIERACGTQDKVCGRPQALHLGNPKSITGIQIDVNKPATPGVYVYQENVAGGGGSTVPADRDWRWVIELEREPVYPNGIKLDDTKVYPSVSVNHALFYTLYRTTSMYELSPVDGSAPVSLPSVALLVGGNIYLADGGDVTITIRRKYPTPPKIYRLPRVAGKCYQVDVRNTCVKGGKRCKPEDYGDKENDFYLYNETFTRPYGEPQYTLKQVTRRTAGLLPKEICFLRDDEPLIESSNDAPCGPVSAGGGGGG